MLACSVSDRNCCPVSAFGNPAYGEYAVDPTAPANRTGVIPVKNIQFSNARIPVAATRTDPADSPAARTSRNAVTSFPDNEPKSSPALPARHRRNGRAWFR